MHGLTPVHSKRAVQDEPGRPKGMGLDRYPKHYASARFGVRVEGFTAGLPGRHLDTHRNRTGPHAE